MLTTFMLLPGQSAIRPCAGPVAVGVGTGVVRPVGRHQPIVEIGRADRVVPHQRIDVVAEERPVPGEPNHSLLMGPFDTGRHVVRSMIDGKRHLVGVVERERSTPGLMTGLANRRKLHVHIDVLRRRKRESEGRRVPPQPEVEARAGPGCRWSGWQGRRRPGSGCCRTPAVRPARTERRPLCGSEPAAEETD